MKRVFAFFCAIALFLTSFPAMAVSATQMDLVAADTDLIEVKPEAPELFPDRRPNNKAVRAPGDALEHELPDGFMDYLKEHFGNCEARFSVEQFNFPYSRWAELRSVVWDETPELFNVYSLGCTYYKSTDTVVEITAVYFPHADTAAEYEICLDKMRSGAEYLLRDVKGNENLTDVEKALILHDRLAVWTEYNAEGVGATVKSKIHTAYSALGEGTAVCQGYAMAYMYLLEQAGIESDYCSSDELNHGWNVVYIDGVAYHVDVTWDDPTNGSSATYNDIYGRVYHRNFLLSSDGIWNTGHEANDYNTTPSDSRYDGEGKTTWWKDSATAVQLIDNNLYYLDMNNGKVVCADNGSTIYAYTDYSSSYRLSSAEEMLLFSTWNNVLAVDPKTGVSSVVYTPPSGYIEGMKYEKGKLHVQLNDGNGNSRRESVDYVAPEVTDFTYTVENSKATITGYTGAGGDITIPATLGGYLVTTIGNSAFSACTNLTSATIPDSVTTIEDEAFYYCYRMTSLTIGNSVTSIGDWAFGYCTSLTSVTIPDSVITIGEYAFAGFLDEETGQCISSLTSVTIGNSVTTIGADAFSACGKLISVTIPDSVTNIEFGAFCFCYDLTSVTIGNGITIIDDYAFRCCESLTSVTIPDSVTSIGYAAFSECTSLTSVTIPNSVNYIDEYAFDYCSSLTDVYYDGTQAQWALVSVGEGNECLQNATMHFAQEPEKPDYTYTVENGKTTITGYTGTGGDITIPDALDGYPVTKIGDSAFSNSTSLTSVTIPNSVTSIGEAAFYNCDGLTLATIGNNVTKIGEWAFLSCKNLTSVTIGDSVTVIGTGAFYGCSNLTAVTIPGSVTKIGGEAFCGCIRLTSVTIPDGVDAIYDYTFYYCESLNAVTIPDSVTYIGEWAFDYCSNLTDVYYDGTQAQWALVSVGEGNECLQNATMHFAQEPEKPDYTYTVENGKTTITGYTGTGGDITIPDTLGGYPVTAVGNYVFYNCTGLTSVTIPGSVVTIGDSAFWNCTSLTSVTIPDSVTAIGDHAFYYCISLTSVTIGNGVTIIGDWAFYHCTGLTSVTIGDSVTTIGDYAFSWCTGLTSVTIPDSVTTIGSSVFSCCDGLTSLTIGNGVTAIGDWAFHHCTGLTSVAIPYSVITIGDYAFVDCTSLTSVTILDSVTTIGSSAFSGCTGLTSVTIPNSVTTIGDSAFSRCASLTSVTIPDSVTTIGDSAFSDCYSLTDVYYGGTAAQWGQLQIGHINGWLTDATIHFHVHNYVDGVCTVCGASGYEPGDLDGVPGVDEDDAIYLLRHVLMPQSFTVDQDVDFDGNGAVNEDDAVYLLRHVLMPESFPL